MPIDRIGKGGGIPPQVPSTGPGETAPTKPFQVNPTGGSLETQKTKAASAVEASPLEKLRAGKIDVDQYVELKLDHATSHLQGLHADELGAVREVLRDKIVQDPQLVDLVRQATGRVPTPRDDE